MFEIGVVTQFEAAHHLNGDFGPATRLHGHTYRVEVSVRGPLLREDGTLCDLATLSDAAQEAVNQLHYHNLDELPTFEGKNSTAEVVAQLLFHQIASHFEGLGLASLRVEVWESPRAYAAYEGQME